MGHPWTGGMQTSSRAREREPNKPSRLYQVEEHVAGQYPAVAPAIAQQAADCAPNLMPFLCVPYKQWSGQVTCPARLALGPRGGGGLRERELVER